MYRVLIIEDEILVSIGLKNMLNWQKFNMQVIGEAPNGQAGYRMYQEKKPDLILTDIKMPIMDGLKLIQAVRQNDKTTRFIILTCYQEFDLVHQALRLGVSDYILKLKMSMPEMEAVLQRVKKELDARPRIKTGTQQIVNRLAENQAMLKLLYNPKGSFHDFCLHAPIASEFSSVTNYTVMSILIFISEQPAADKANSLNNTSLLIWDLLEQEAQKVNNSHVVRKTDDQYLILLDLSGKQNPDSLIRGLCQNINSSLQTYISVNSLIGVSQPSSSQSEFISSLNQAQSALDGLYFSDVTYLIALSDVEQLKQYLKCIEDLYSSISLLIINQEIKALLQTKVLALKQHRFSPQKYREALIYILYWLAARQNLQPEQMTPEFSLLVQYIKESAHYSIAKKHWIKALLVLSQQPIDQNIHSREIQRVITYIDNNLGSKLCLKTLAEQAGMSPNYLCSLFKKEMSINIFDYINSIRIEKAKCLLTDNDQKAYVIAGEVGFSDESYFIRVFKRVAGMTPNEYRKRAAN
ncbi:response regulator [Oscillospiraceae bacterium HV4-5-C5C]|nr:response regulator [Oscillospiraceae bacterium HV4-5-C5C]